MSKLLFINSKKVKLYHILSNHWMNHTHRKKVKEFRKKTEQTKKPLRGKHHQTSSSALVDIYLQRALQCFGDIPEQRCSLLWKSNNSHKDSTRSSKFTGSLQSSLFTLTASTLLPNSNGSPDPGQIQALKGKIALFTSFTIQIPQKRKEVLQRIRVLGKNCLAICLLINDSILGCSWWGSGKARDRPAAQENTALCIAVENPYKGQKIWTALQQCSLL